jgi:hypothetical protein
MTSPTPAVIKSKRLVWAVGAIAVAGASWVLVQLYQPPRLYDQYLPPMRRFLTAVIEGDSAALAAAGASSRAVNWALQVEREKPGTLRELAALGTSWGGPARRPAGDSILVLFRGPKDGICSNSPILVTFAGPPSDAHVLHVAAECITP